MGRSGGKWRENVSEENERGRSVSGQRDREKKRGGEGKGEEREKRGKMENVSGEKEEGETVN